MHLLLANFGDWILSVFAFIPYIIIAILILLLMITIHELGHYIAGKKLGFKINEFAIGMGKPIYQRTNKETGEKFSIRIFPLGGFCAFEGEDDSSENAGAFTKQKPWKRLIVLFAGVFFNFLSAIIFAFMMLLTTGYHIQQIKGFDDASINVYSASNPYGLKINDAIYKVGDKNVTYIGNNLLGDLLEPYEAEQPITLTVKRDGKMVEVIVYKYTTVALDKNKEPILDKDNQPVMIEVLGINEFTTFPLSFGDALVNTIPFCLEMSWKILVLLFELFTGQINLTKAGGPIASIAAIATISQSSLSHIFVLLPLIAINLAMFNILPIPALDGARMIFVTIEWIRGKPVNPKVEGAIHAVGLMALLAFVLLLDILALWP